MSHQPIDAVLEAMEALDNLDVREHPPVYEHLHRELRTHLDDVSR